MREPQPIASEADHPRPSLEPVHTKAVVGRGDRDHRPGVGKLDIALRAETDRLPHRQLVSRDRGEEGFGAGEPFAIALAAFLDLSAVLVGRSHGGGVALPARGGRTRPTGRPSLFVNPSAPGGLVAPYARAVCCSVSIVTLGSFW